MVKKWFLVGAMLLVSLLVVGCGIAQEDYDAVVAERDVARAQVASLQSDHQKAFSQIQTLQSDYDKVKSDLTASQTQIQSLQDELSAMESGLEATEAKMAEARSKMEILNAIFVPSLTGELDEMTETEAANYFFELRDNVSAIGDPTLTAKFQAIVDTFSDEAVMDFFLYLLEDIPEVLV